MAAQAGDIDTATCPICGKPNQCAMSCSSDAEDINANEARASCWCMAATLAPGALDAVPPEARGRACICPNCAARTTFG